MKKLRKQEVEIPIGTALMPAYLVAQDDLVKRPGVVVFQEIFGVNKEMRRIADLLADAGFTALVPNFYHRTAPQLDAAYNEAGMKEGMAAAGATTLDSLMDDAKASLAYLQEHSSCSGNVAAWGFCFGGTVAYLAATVTGYKAAVCFYGGQIAVSHGERPAAIEFTSTIQCPVFLAFGEQDQSIPPEHVAAIKMALKAAGKSYELQVFPEEGHGFFRNGINGESTAGARTVWPKVKDFLARNLS